MKLRNRLKSIRHKHEMSQVEFAVYLNVDKGTYNTWERERRHPSLIVAIQLAERLECSVTDIFYIEHEQELQGNKEG